MNTKELAALLNGVEYGNEYDRRVREVETMAKACGLVIAAGESDDLLEFYGSFRDEADAPELVLIDTKGLLPPFEGASEDEEAMRSYLVRKETARQIEAVWCEDGAGYAWILKTDIPHETFSIMEDGKGFSRGIVFALADLVQKAEPVGPEPGTVPAPAWQDRVITEKAELDERIVKLDAFIVSPDFWRLKTIDARLLQEQVVAMRCYSLVLGKRIEQFGGAA